MSAIPSLSAPPVPGPQPVAPPPVAKSFSWLRLLLLAVLVGGGVWAVYHFVAKPAQTNTPQMASVRTVKVISGPLQKSLRLTGSTIARNFANITAPRLRAADRGLVLIYLAKSGSMVQKGDVIAQIDAQSAKDRLDDLEAQIASTAADLKKQKAQIAVNMENLQQTLRASKAQLDSIKLDVNAAEIRTPIDREQLKLSAEEAEATYREQLKDLDTRKIGDAAQLRSAEISQEISVRRRDQYKSDLEKFTVVAPMSGLVVMQTIFRGADMAQVQMGDQVNPGQPFMKIVDVNSMQVKAASSQVESEEMRLGQPAVVYFDAFPGLKLNARVAQIGAIAVPGAVQNYYLRNVPVYLSITDRDNRVIPDLTTSADVVVSQTAHALVIPRAALESKDGKWFVRAKRAQGFELREVKLGAGDNVNVAVLEGLREGDEVAADQSSVTRLLASN